MPRKLTAARNANSMLAVPGLLPARMAAPRPAGHSFSRQDILLGEGICRRSHLGGTWIGLGFAFGLRISEFVFRSSYLYPRS